MESVKEVIAYLEMELLEAYEMHDQAKGQDKQAALFQLVRATTIQSILDQIRG